MDNSPSSTEPVGSESTQATGSAAVAAAQSETNAQQFPATIDGDPSVVTLNSPTFAATPASLAPVMLAIPVADHAESVSLVKSLQAKLANFEHDVVADIKADVAKLKALLHL